MSNRYLQVNTFFKPEGGQSLCWGVLWLLAFRSKGCPNVYSMISSFSGILKLRGATFILTPFELLII
jgi:hypothetical protein